MPDFRCTVAAGGASRLAPLAIVWVARRWMQAFLSFPGPPIFFLSLRDLWRVRFLSILTRHLLHKQRSPLRLAEAGR